MIETRLVEAPQFKALSQIRLQTPPQPLKRHPTDEIGRELATALLGPNHFQNRFRLGLKRPLHEKVERLLVGHAGAVHAIIQDGVADRAQIPLELIEAEL